MRRLALWPTWLWLLIFIALPLAVVISIAFAQAVDSVPPYALGLHLDSFALLLGDPLYLAAALRSLEVASVSSALCLLIGYPMALAIADAPPARRPTLLLLVMLPFWTGFLLRVTALIALLRDDGWINAALGLVGLGPLRLLYTGFAMYLGIAYCYLPFMILPLYARLAKRDTDLELAAADLGASPASVFLRVTLPLSLPGVWAGLALTFVPALGEYIIPELLGGPGAQTFGRALWTEFFSNRDWPTAAALASVLLAVVLLPLGLARAWTALRARTAR